MTARQPHHPLPEDERSRHDRLPESIEAVRDTGEDDPDGPEPSATEPPVAEYRNPDGRRYPG